MPYPEKEFLLDSGFAVKITAPNKQSFRVKSALKSLNHVSNSWQINNFTTFLGVKITLSCFKQLPLLLFLILWRHGVVVITTAQLHSSMLELRFCADSNPDQGVLKIHDGANQ